jgi:hypothetical protein
MWASTERAYPAIARPRRANTWVFVERATISERERHVIFTLPHTVLKLLQW